MAKNCELGGTRVVLGGDTCWSGTQLAQLLRLVVCLTGVVCGRDRASIASSHAAIDLCVLCIKVVFSVQERVLVLVSHVLSQSARVGTVLNSYGRLHNREERLCRHGGINKNRRSAERLEAGTT